MTIIDDILNYCECVNKYIKSLPPQIHLEDNKQIMELEQKRNKMLDNLKELMNKKKVKL